MTAPLVVRLVPGLGLDGAAWRPTVESLPPAWSRGLDVALLPGYGARAARRADLRPVAQAELLLRDANGPGGADLADRIVELEQAVGRLMAERET